MIIFWDQLPQLSPGESTMGLGGDLHSLSASNVLPLAALFHSGNLVEMV